MRVALTGAAGFIGSHLARLILGEGHAVSALIRPGTDRRRIRDIEARLSLMPGDLTDYDTVQRWLAEERPDVCIHLAWRGRYAAFREAEENLASLQGSLNLLRAVGTVGCRRLVGAGTCFEYDTSHAVLGERTPLVPHEIYGASKVACFLVCEQFCRLARVEFAWTRLFQLYGPQDDRDRLIPNVVLTLLRGEAAEVTKGEQIRDFLYVEDVASALWTVARSQFTGVVNIASGTPMSVADVVREIGRLLARSDLLRIGALPYRAGEPMRLQADASLLRNALGWSPRFDLEHGLQSTIDWWRSVTI